VERALGAEVSRWSRHGLRQVHGGRVVEAGAETGSGEPPEADAVWTSERGRLLVVRTADCVPVLLAATGAGGVRAVAAVHAGWRGLVAGVVAHAVSALEGAVPSSRILATIGPSIGPCCYEIGPDAAEPLDALGAPGGVAPRQGRHVADLPRIARFLLAASGASVADPDPPPCTRCHAELFPSWRRDASTVRMASFVGLGA
jgi:YfiH family protein